MNAIPALQEFPDRAHAPAASVPASDATDRARRRARVALIEDGADAASGLRRTLEANGYQVYVASDERDGDDVGRDVDLILLDVELPAAERSSMLRTLREAFRQRNEPHRATSRVEELGFGDVRINTVASIVTRGGEPVALTPKEFDLLVAFVRNPGVVLSRTALLHEVWGHRAEVMTRTVDIHVAELRRKLEDQPSSPRHFVTVWKRGYRFDP